MDVVHLRGMLGLSQRELAAEVGVNVGSVHRWERGVRAPRHHRVVARLLSLTEGAAVPVLMAPHERVGTLPGPYQREFTVWQKRARLAEGTVFTHGLVVVCWYGPPTCTETHADMDTFKRTLGREGCRLEVIFRE